MEHLGKIITPPVKMGGCRTFLLDASPPSQVIGKFFLLNMAGQPTPPNVPPSEIRDWRDIFF